MHLLISTARVLRFAALALAAVLGVFPARAAATDSGANYYVAPAATWVAGANLGTGFGPWSFGGTGQLLGTSTAASVADLGTSFGLHNGDGFANRAFSGGALADGQTASLRMAVNFRGGYKGVSFIADGLEVARFTVSSDDYQFNDQTISTLEGATGDWTYSNHTILTVSVTRSGADLVASVARSGEKTAAYSTTLVGLGAGLDSLSLFSYGAGEFPENAIYFNDLALRAAPDTPLASDIAANYAPLVTWIDGANEGSGFGPWTLGGSGHQIASSLVADGGADIGRSFGFGNSANGFAERPFTDGALVDGQTFSLRLVVNFRGGYKGVSLKAGGTDIAKVTVSDDDYEFNDAPIALATGASGDWSYASNTVIDVAFTRSGSDLLVVVTRTGGLSAGFTTTLPGLGAGLDSFSLYSYAADGSPQNNIYFNDLEVVGDSLPPLTDAQRSAPSVTRDGDEFVITVADSVTGHAYQLQRSTDLAIWDDLGDPLAGTGADLVVTVPVTPGVPRVFFRFLVTR